MDLNYAHQTSVGRITLGAFGLVALATGDFLGGLATFVGLIAALLVLCPVMLLIRWDCTRRGVSTTRRRLFMLAPTLGLALWVFSWTNCFGGYQRGLLRHGMTTIPDHTSIVTYSGHSGLMGEGFSMTITCSPSSLRSILDSQFASEPYVSYPGSDVAYPKQPVGELTRYSRVLGSMHCSLITDSTFGWAAINYSAGS
jgi:hypothetical protein